MILQFYLLSPNKISLLLKIAFNSGPWTVNQGGDQQPLSIFHNIWTTTHALYGYVTHVQSIYGIICFVYDWGAITEIQYKNGWGFNRKSFTIFYRKEEIVQRAADEKVSNQHRILYLQTFTGTVYFVCTIWKCLI